MKYLPYCLAALFLLFPLDLLLGYMRLPRPKVSWVVRAIVTDSKLGWRFKQGQKFVSPDGRILYETDLQGRAAVQETTPKHAPAVYFFGDSMTAGYGVTNHEAFPNILAGTLFKGKRRVYNMAVFGYGLPQMYQAYLNIENRIEQNDLIIFTPISEDLTRTYQDFRFLAENIMFSRMKPEFYPVYDKGNLRMESLAAFYSMKNKVKLLFMSSPVSGTLYDCLHRNSNSVTIMDSKEIFRRIRASAKKKGAGFRLFFLPLDYEKREGAYSIPVEDIPHTALIRDIPSGEATLSGLYLPDGHFSPEGHRLIAKLIEEHLSQDARIITRAGNKSYLLRRL